MEKCSLVSTPDIGKIGSRKDKKRGLKGHTRRVEKKKGIQRRNIKPEKRSLLATPVGNIRLRRRSKVCNEDGYG